jgi:3-oxoacid CoA-transferase subunit A
VFITGDKHGDFRSDFDYQRVKNFCENYETTLDDFIIVLGDHGIHYDGEWHDHNSRKKLGKYPITFIMIRGNHDMRPEPGWKRLFLMKPGTVTGWFWEDPEVANVLYTDEFGWYTFRDQPVFVIGGAYSVDKYYRLEMRAQGHTGYRWFRDEQLSEKEMTEAYRLFFSQLRPGQPATIMSHTCPLGFKPADKLLPMVDQSTVDESMEKWMDKLYLDALNLGIDFNKWYCGHWHTDRTVEPVRFLYHDIIEFGG